MRRYETIVIIDNDLSEEGRTPILEKLNDLIQQYNGLQVMADEWGTKKLAYEIKKKTRGYYVCLDYCGSGLLVNEIERFFRIDDRVLKYMTVLLDKDVDIENVKKEIAEAEEAKVAQAEAEKAKVAQAEAEKAKVAQAEAEKAKAAQAEAEEAKTAQIDTPDVEPTDEPDDESRALDDQEDETSEVETTLPENKVEEA